MTDTALPTATLYYRNGSSDKEYRAWIEGAGDGYVVNFAYGRRGSSLTTGTKTQAPVDRAKAQVIFDRLVGEKQSKGYVASEDGTPYQHSDKVVSGLLPQLLNPIGEDELAVLLADPHWTLQEKFDGKRMMLRVGETGVEAINKLGLVVGVAAPIAAAAATLPAGTVLDGEVVGERFWAFDLLADGGADLTAQPYRQRHAALVALLYGADPTLTAVGSWHDPQDKADQLAALRERNAEGAVFKHLQAPYTAGRPASGGLQRKFKFVATASVRVAAVNGKRSVAVELLDGQTWAPVGNVTIPPNRDVPAVGDVVEVRYLYAIAGGSLFQPVYLGVRDDIEPGECVVGQLKLKTTEAAS